MLHLANQYSCCLASKNGHAGASDTGDGGAEGGPTEGSEGEVIDTRHAETGYGEVESGFSRSW